MLGSLPSELSPPAVRGGGAQVRPACSEGERRASADATLVELAGVKVGSE